MDRSRWRGKSWATLGDSITEANGYQPLVSAELSLGIVSNYGKSGCPMTAGGEQNSGATVHVGRQIEKHYDCVTIFAGTNDYRLSKPLGVLGERDIYTFIGAYQILIESILTDNPRCRLNLWTPLQRDKDGYDSYRNNEQGQRLLDYVNAIKDLGLEYALPVLDLYSVSGLNKLTLPIYTSDGLHPNDEGFARIAPIVCSFLSVL